MKNKYKVFCVYVSFFLIFSSNIVNSNQSFTYEAQQIEILDQGNIIKGEKISVHEKYFIMEYYDNKLNEFNEVCGV